MQDVSNDLREYVDWVREAQNDSTPRQQRIDINDMDPKLLDKAADLIDQYRNELIEWRTVHNQSTDDLID